MRLKMILSVGLLVSATQLFGQVSPTGFQRAVPLKLGVGYSNFNSDWSTAGRISGPSLWVDWSFNQVPAFLSGLGVEIEARDLNYGQTGPAASKLRFDTAAAGPIYTFRQYRAIRPYGAFLAGLGSFDFPPPKNLRYSHDTRTIYAPSGGVECLIASRVRVRAAYEYQIWPDLVRSGALKPSGFTLGTTYDFGPTRTRVEY